MVPLLGTLSRQWSGKHLRLVLRPSSPSQHGCPWFVVFFLAPPQCTLASLIPVHARGAECICEEMDCSKFRLLITKFSSTVLSISPAIILSSHKRSCIGDVLLQFYNILVTASFQFWEHLSPQWCSGAYILHVHSSTCGLRDFCHPRLSYLFPQNTNSPAENTISTNSH